MSSGAGADSVSADEAGAFELHDMAPGIHRLVVRYKNLSRVVPVRVPVGADVELEPIDLADDHTVIGTRTLELVNHAREAEESDAAELAGEESPVASQSLQALVEASGLDMEAWESFFSGEPSAADAEAAPDTKTILGLASALTGQISPGDAAAILAALAKMNRTDVAAWIQSNASMLSASDTGALTPESLAMALSLLRSNLVATAGSTKGPAVAPSLPSLDREVVLYDASQGTLPAGQGWWYLSNPPFTPNAVQSMGGPAALDTTAERTIKAGYFTEDPISGALFRHPAMTRLQRDPGFVVRFRARLNSEKHVRTDRAGLSLIVICDDLEALELGFWRESVWAQSDRGKPIFQDSRAESERHNATESLTLYDLTVQGDQYSLHADGARLLRGRLRNYTRFGGFPYDVPNFIFIGDNTTSAHGAFELELVALRPAGETAAAEAESGLTSREAARRIAIQSALSPQEALEWLSRHAGELTLNPDGSIPESSLQAALNLLSGAQPATTEGEAEKRPESFGPGGGGPPPGGGEAAEGELRRGGMEGGSQYQIGGGPVSRAHDAIGAVNRAGIPGEMNP